jgi:glyceraldehyde-3-phosphate dehydrogenase (NAD(P))
VKTLASEGKNLTLERGRFVCLRRANDISQDSGFLPAPNVGKHDDPKYGTHHARDASHLLETLGWKPEMFSSALKLNTQYMHALWFDLKVSRPTTKDEIVDKFRKNDKVALTERRSANQVFSFGRDHGYYGRLLSQTVISTPTLTMPSDHEIVGFCFTPQDGNSLASSIAAALWLMEPERDPWQRMDPLKRFFFQEI